MQARTAEYEAETGSSEQQQPCDRNESDERIKHEATSKEQLKEAHNAAVDQTGWEGKHTGAMVALRPSIAAVNKHMDEPHLDQIVFAFHNGKKRKQSRKYKSDERKLTTQPTKRISALQRLHGSNARCLRPDLLLIAHDLT